MTYFNPKSIQNFTNVANEGKFLKKTGNDITFANASSRMKFVNFTGNTWNFDVTDDATFTYGTINANTVVTVLSPTDISKRELLHILRIDNTDSVKHTVSFQSDSVQTELLSPYQFNVYANSSIEFIATAFMDSDDGSSPVNPKTQVSICAVYGYEPYNAVVNPMQFLVMNDLPQSNWNETNPSSKAYIQNKPNIVSSILFNGTPATVSDGIATITAAIPDAQIQSNWAQTDPTAVDFIKNKPDSLQDFVNDLPRTTISVTPNSDNTQVTIVIDYHDGTTPSTTTIPLSGGSGSLTQLPSNWNETNLSSVQYIQNKPILATVATSGNYNDLSNKPTIPAAQVQSDWDATSGMGEILNKPTNVSAFNNDAGYITAHQSIDSIISSTSAQTAPTIAQSLAGGDTVTLHKVAWTGTYDDLLNKPTIPVVPVNVSAFNNDAGYITSVPAQVKSDWNEANPASAAYIENKPSLFSGSYDDLTDTPTIPAAQVNSDWNAVSGVAQILNKPTIPAEQVNSDWNVSDPASKAYILNKPDVPEDSVDYLRFEFSGTVQGRNFSLKKVGNPSLLSLEYKLVSYTDGSIIRDWTTWTPDNDGNRRIFDLGANGPVIIYLRGDNYDTNLNIFGNSNYYQFYFKATDSCYCHGNLLTIYKKDGKVTSVPQGYRFYKLFASTSNDKCNIQSAPYVKLQSASSSCFNEIFSGNTYGLTVKDIKFDIVKGTENYNSSRHLLNSAINPANGEIYVEKPSADSYVITLLYGSQTVDFSTLMSKYSAGAHIRCKDTTTVQGVEIYADMCSYDTYTNPVAGTVNRFTFKYVKAESDTRECWIYTCYKGTNTTNTSWNKVETTLDEVPAVSSATWGKFLTNDSVNGLAWEDVLVTQVNSDWNATSGVAEILNKPTIPTVPTNVSAFNNDVGYITASGIPENRTINHEQITDSSLGDINLHDGYYFPNAVQDYDGNWYGAVIIGDQVWLAEDLRTEHYLDGTAIQHLEGGATAVQPAFYHYNTTVEWYVYNRVTALQESSHTGLVENFHVPTSNDITTFVSYITKQKRYTFGTEPNLSFAKAICSNDYWQSSNVENSPGNNPQLNNATGFNALPLGWDNPAGWTFAIPTKTPESLVGIYMENGSSDWYINVDGTTAGYTDYDILFQIRCLSNLTPIQFRNWYIKQYGTLQHHLNNGTADGTTVIVKNVTDNTPSIVENIYKDNLKHVILNIHSLTQVYQGSLTLNAATSNDVLVGTPYTIVLKSDDNYNAKISINFKVNNVSIPCYHQTTLNISAGDAPRVINLRCYYPITNLFTLTEELS